MILKHFRQFKRRESILITYYFSPFNLISIFSGCEQCDFPVFTWLLVYEYTTGSGYKMPHCYKVQSMPYTKPHSVLRYNYKGNLIRKPAHQRLICSPEPALLQRCSVGHRYSKSKKGQSSSTERKPHLCCISTRANKA